MAPLTLSSYSRLTVAALAVLMATVAAIPGAPVAAVEDDGLVLASLGGEELAEADLERGVVMVIAWASWSPRCKDIVPRVNALQEDWGDKARIVTVNFQEDAAAAEEFLAGQELQVPVFLDESGAFSKKYAIFHLPGLHVFVNGETAYRGRLPARPRGVIADVLGE